MVTTIKPSVQETILTGLKNLNPGHSLMAAAIHGAAQHPANYGNLVDMIASQYRDNPKAMTEIVGAETMTLILAQ